MERITEADRRAIQKIYRKIGRSLAPKLAQLPIDDSMAKVLIAQNALRCCMEVVLNEMLPYSEHDLAELGTRLAAYAVTAAPIENHEALTRGIIGGLPVAVEEKVRTGAVIRADWRVDGHVRSNIPTGAEVN